MKICVASNLLQNTIPEVFSSMAAEFFFLGKNPEITNVLQYMPQRLTIDRMRNEAAKYAMSNDCKWLVFVDDDVVLTPNTINNLVKTDYDIIMADTYIRGYPFQPMAFENKPTEDAPFNLFPVEDPRAIANPETGIADVFAVGFSCCAINVDLLLNMEPPYFVTGPANTEDIYFCVRAKQEVGDHVKIGVHTKYPTWHQVERLFVGQSNVEELRKFYESQNIKSKERSDDSGKSYHEKLRATQA
jgi:glycosyltransferase involved in cell wall biosynthesis